MAGHSPEELLRSAKVEEVNLAKVRSDFSYQRETNETLVDRIAEKWNVLGAELPLVADRGPRPADGDVQGGLFVINGQHRIKAAQKKGIQTLLCRVVNLRNVPDPGSLEAEYRLMTNERVSDRAVERFKAQIRSGDPESEAIVKILEEQKTQINMIPDPEKGINCVSTIEGIYRIDDGVLLRETLHVINDVWETIGGKNANASSLKALAWFIEKHAEESDRGRLVDKLKRIGYASWEQRARTMQLSLSGSMWVNFYKALVALYNEGLKKNKLEWKMRGTQVMSDRRGAQRSQA